MENGHLSFFGSVFLGLISWLTPENIDLGLKVITGIGAVITGALAARYYWYAGKEKKESWKNRKKNE